MTPYERCWCGDDDTTGGHVHEPAMTQRTTNLSHSSSSPYEQGIEAALKESQKWNAMIAEGDPATSGMGELEVMEFAIEAFLSVQPTRTETPTHCKHGSHTMHDGGEHACAGPIAEARHYWLVEQRRVST